MPLIGTFGAGSKGGYGRGGVKVLIDATGGTIEEIEIHRSLGKPVLRYFRKQKRGIHILVDAILRRKATKQEREVLAYKEQCMKDGRKDYRYWLGIKLE